jgi:hypothetical protein
MPPKTRSAAAPKAKTLNKPTKPKPVVAPAAPVAAKNAAKKVPSKAAAAKDIAAAAHALLKLSRQLKAS